MTELTRVRDVVTIDELNELTRRCDAAAAADGYIFVFDEGAQALSDRTNAAYLQRLAKTVGMDALAARLNPSDYAPSGIEKLVNVIDKHSRLSLSTTHEVDTDGNVR